MERGRIHCRERDSSFNIRYKKNQLTQGLRAWKKRALFASNLRCALNQFC